MAQIHVNVAVSLSVCVFGWGRTWHATIFNNIAMYTAVDPINLFTLCISIALCVLQMEFMLV